MRILYNFASRSRPKQFFDVLKNIREMSHSMDYIVVAKLDDDDPEWAAYWTEVHKWKEVIPIGGTSKSKIDAINRDIPRELHWDILVNISDDQKFIVKGFDKIIREYCLSGTFLHFPEVYKKAACSVMSIMHRDYYESRGYVFHKDYYSLWCDVEETEVAKLLFAYKYVPVTIFQHDHYSTGTKKDELYQRNDTYKKDRSTYLTRRVQNFGLTPNPPTPFLLIKYATRGRWKEFFAAIDNIYATIGTNQFKITVSADLDDEVMNSTEVRDFCKRYHNVELHYCNNSSKVEAINADFNPNTNWWWCVNMSDDMKFTVPYWDMLMLEEIKSVWGDDSDFFAHFNDGYVGEKLPTLNVCGRKFYDRFGYIYHPDYKSVSCDAENMYVAMMLGRYHYFDNVYFNHIHPANLKEPSDHIYRRNHKYGKKDTELYFERLKRKFDVKDPVLIPEEMKPFL